LVLGSCLATYAFVNLTLTTHLTGDYLSFKNEYLEIVFPKDWFGWDWEDKNATSGNSYTALFGSIYSLVAVTVTVYDIEATEVFMTENDLTDSFSVVIHLANLMYEQSLQDNDNATISFIKNDTTRVSNNNAHYTEFLINGVTLDENLHNWTSRYLSFMDQQRLVHISYQGSEEDWIQTYNVFEIMLDSIKI
jgi:hypothetical protein